MALRRVSLLLALLLSGCLVDSTQDGTVVVAVIGDSNAADVPPPSLAWPARLTLPAGVIVRNYAQPFATAAGYGLADPDGPAQVQRAVDEGGDVLVIALGTNDVNAQRTPAAIVADLQQFVGTIAASRRVYLLQPVPAFNPPTTEPALEALRGAIRAQFPAWRIIEPPALTVDDYQADGFHLNDAGRAKVATVVSARLNDPNS